MVTVNSIFVNCFFQVQLVLDPPLLISDDVKIEFMTKPRLDFVGLNSKMWRKARSVWLNIVVQQAFSYRTLPVTEWWICVR